MPASLLVQLSLITTLLALAVHVVSWALLLAAMTVPYVFAGVVVSLALTRSPVPGEPGLRASTCSARRSAASRSSWS